jgi:hypothetical protein
MSTVISPNMKIVVPVASSEPGPAWAQEIQTALQTTVDGHDHSSNKGVPITQAGIDITGDLSVNNNNLTNVKTSVYGLGGATGVSPQELGATPSTGDMQWTDNSLNPVVVTKNGAVNVPAMAMIARNTTQAIPSSTGVVGVVNMCDSTGGAITLTLPAALGNGGVMYIFKDVGLAAGTNPITIQRAGSDTIIDTSSVTSKAINTNGARAVFVSNGVSKWLVVG